MTRSPPGRNFDTGAKFLDDAPELVTQEERRRPPRTSGFEAFEFPPADAARGDANEHFVVGQTRLWMIDSLAYQNLNQAARRGDLRS